jgi:hypothetical protein
VTAFPETGNWFAQCDRPAELDETGYPRANPDNEPELGVPAVCGRATVNSIAVACTKARFPGNYATSSGRANDERSRISRLVAEHFGLDPISPRGFVDFAIARDSDGTPRLILGEHEWDHVIPEAAAREFEARATQYRGKAK